MNSIGLDPTSSEKISASMVRFCGFVELDKTMNEWGEFIIRNQKMYYMSVINQYAIRWNRKLVLLQYTRTTYDDYERIYAIKKDIVRLQNTIDRLVEKAIVLGADRAMMGMLMNHYGDRNRIDIAESLIIAFFGEESDILPDFLRVASGDHSTEAASESESISSKESWYLTQ
jgi:hypothetical protein